MHVPRANWIIQWALNQLVLYVRRYLARSAPAGRRPRKPTTHNSAWATILLWYGCRGRLNEPVLDPGVEVWVPPELRVEMGLVGSLELKVRVLVRSSFIVPESMCCTRLASTEELEGLVELYAQMIVCEVSELAAMV